MKFPWQFLIPILISLGAPVDGQEPFEAYVDQVVRGDGIKIVGPDGPQLVALYGVVIDDFRVRDAQRAKELVTEIIGGQTVLFRRLKNLEGLQYVEVTLPSGEVLNELLLREGLARIDSVTAHDDAKYRLLESGARDASMGLWERNTDTPNAPSVPKKTDSDKSLAEYNAKRELRQIAEFDAQFRIWRTFPENVREAIRIGQLESHLRRRQSDDRLLTTREQSVTDAEGMLAENSSRIRQRQDAIASASAAEAWTLSEVYDDFDLQWNSSMMNSFVEDYNAEVATGQLYSARISGILANEYAYKTQSDLNRVGQQAAGVSARYESARQQHRNAIGYLSSERNVINAIGARAVGMERAAAFMVGSRDRRLSESRARTAILDRAIEEKYQPQTELEIAGRFELSNEDTPFRITLDTDLWQLSWYVLSVEGDAKFNFSIQDAAETRPIQHISTNRTPYDAFEILDGPGEFRVTPHSSGHVAVVVEVYELRQ